MIKTLFYTAWTWLMLVIVAFTSFWLLLPLSLLTQRLDPTRRWTGIVFRRSARWVAALSPQWTFAAQPPYPRDLRRPHVVVSNHESHLDAFLISHLPYEMKWLAKDSLFKLPFIGWNMALAGDVKIVRGESQSVQRALGRCRRLLQQGMSVFLFPEGTRATSSALLPFKDGAFRLALEAGVPILPLAVAGTAQGLRKNSLRFYPSRALVCVGAAVSVEPWLLKMADRENPLSLADATAELKAAVQEQIRDMRGRLRERLKIADDDGKSATSAQ